MPDPSFLLIEARPIRLAIWHDEPNGHDAFEKCGRPPQNATVRLVWAVRHAGHLRYRWWPYLNVRRWIVDRCDGCGQRFRWKEARHSYQSTDKVWHDPCMSLRHVRSQLDDITKYLRAEADSSARWRVEYRLNNLDKADAQP